MSETPKSVEVRELESPALREGDSIHLQTTISLLPDGGVRADSHRNAWVETPDGDLVYYPEAF